MKSSCLNVFTLDFTGISLKIDLGTLNLARTKWPICFRIPNHKHIADCVHEQHRGQRNYHRVIIHEFGRYFIPNEEINNGIK